MSKDLQTVGDTQTSFSLSETSSHRTPGHLHNILIVVAVILILGGVISSMAMNALGDSKQNLNLFQLSLMLGYLGTCTLIMAIASANIEFDRDP